MTSTLVHAIYIFIAYLIDRIIGDPRLLPHPVILIGKSIRLLEKVIRTVIVKENYLKLAGLLHPLIIAGGSYGIVAVLLYGLN